MCQCDCHLACPLGGNHETTHAEWVVACTCPGAPARREQEAKRSEDSERRREVFRSVDLGNGRSPQEIQQDLLAAYEKAGIDPKTDFARLSRFLAAGTATKGTRHVRLLGETVSAVVAARKWWTQNMRRDGNTWTQITDD